ncbi:insulinase family protein [Mesorhizobium sp. M0062]|uniref:insulinase family protein n=1 Tax=Mesorhizobium sp. M0062 TaxID=2956867 RepID=UPI003338B2DD
MPHRDELLDGKVNAKLRPNQPYRIPVNGWTQEMEKLNGTDRFTMCNEYRRPNNAVLVVAGDAEPETVKALAAKTYGKVSRGPDLPPRNRPVEPD